MPDISHEKLLELVKPILEFSDLDADRVTAIRISPDRVEIDAHELFEEEGHPPTRRLGSHRNGGYLKITIAYVVEDQGEEENV